MVLLLVFKASKRLCFFLFLLFFFPLYFSLFRENGTIFQMLNYIVVVQFVTEVLSTLGPVALFPILLMGSKNNLLTIWMKFQQILPQFLFQKSTIIWSKVGPFLSFEFSRPLPWLVNSKILRKYSVTLKLFKEHSISFNELHILKDLSLKTLADSYDFLYFILLWVF